jgi:hypothetical protein
LKVRRLIRDRVLFSNAAWSPQAWQQFIEALHLLLGVAEPHPDPAVAYAVFLAEGAEDPEEDNDDKTTFAQGGVSIRLGSIHSVKGRTVDAIMVMETEVRKGPALAMRALDISTVLPHALGVAPHDFAANPAQLAAATNVFVGITRPRHVLALAVKKEALSAEVIAAAEDQGWVIRDLVPA